MRECELLPKQGFHASNDTPRAFGADVLDALLGPDRDPELAGDTMQEDVFLWILGIVFVCLFVCFFFFFFFFFFACRM